MGFQLMCLKINFRFKNNEFFFQAFLFRTQEMFLLKMHDQGIIIQVILLILSIIVSITNEAAFVGFPAVVIELIATIKPHETKPAFRMTFKSALVWGTWKIIALSFMLLQFFESE